MLVFALGLFVGAVATTAALWLLSGLLAGLPGVVASVMCLLAVLLLLCHDLQIVSLRLPENHRQVPQAVLHKPGILPSLQFGVELGTGLRTYVPAATAYMTAVSIVAIGVPPMLVPVIAGGFALGRVATPATRLLSGDVEAWDVLLAQRLRLIISGAAVVTALLLAGWIVDLQLW